MKKRVDSSLPQTPLEVTLMQKCLSPRLCLALQQLCAPQTVQWVDMGQDEGVMMESCHTRQLLGQPPEQPSKSFSPASGRGKDLGMKEHRGNQAKGSSRIHVITPEPNATTTRGRVSFSASG